MQTNRSWLHESPLSHVRYFIPAFACALHSWLAAAAPCAAAPYGAFCAPLWGPGAEARDFPSGKVKHYSTAGKLLFSPQFHTL